jgi:amino acid transporter
VLAVFGSSSADAWASIGIDTALCLIMLAIAVAGIRITARTQIAMAAVEYLILIVFSLAGLLAVLGHRAGTVPVTRGWSACPGSAAAAASRRACSSRYTSTACGMARCT